MKHIDRLPSLVSGSHWTCVEEEFVGAKG